MHNYKKLEIWKKSRLLCSSIYSATATFPPEEKFGLANQIRRASISIPSNIAEGSSRRTDKDFKRFLEIALGSGYELETQLLIATDLQFISLAEQQTLSHSLDEILKMVAKLKSAN